VFGPHGRMRVRQLRPWFLEVLHCLRFPIYIDLWLTSSSSSVLDTKIRKIKVWME